MSADDTEQIEKPKWYQSAIWTGADLFGLVRTLHRGGWRVHPARIPDCCIDLAFSVGNTSLRFLQTLVYGRQIARLTLPDDPIFVIGHWRTGTTLLHELLSLDSRHTAPTTYQCFAPNHFLLTERLLKRWTAFTLPANRPPDRVQMNWDAPQEDEFALCNLGVPSPYNTIAMPNGPLQNQEYLDLTNLSDKQVERWKTALARFVRQVLYRSPGRLILKSPTHTCRIPTLLQLFPKAKFIHIVRNPVVVFMSTMHLWKSLYVTQGFQHPTFEHLREQILETFLHMHFRLEQTRQRVPSDNFVNLRYEDLVADIPGTMQRVYESMSLGSFDEVRDDFHAYAAAKSDFQTNRYEFPPDLAHELSERWRPYYETYGYALEDATR